MKVFGLLAGLLLATAPSALAASPHLVAEHTDFDFGEIWQGEQVGHTFLFRNTGDAPLNITKVRSSCGCTAALVSAETIAPGGSGEVKATFDSTRFTGPVSKTIYLYNNDPDQPELHFVLHGLVKAILTTNPESLQIRVTTAAVGGVGRVTITNQGTKELKIVSTQLTNPELTATLAQKVLGPGKSVEVVVQAKPKPDTPRVNGYLLVQTDDSKVPELRIPVIVTGP